MMLDATVETGISPQHRETIASVLRGVEGKLRKVAIFGSRATGRYRAGSDLDLVLYGTLTPLDLGRLMTEFRESSLPFGVDVVADDLADADLKEHVDRYAVPVWETASGP